MKSVSEPRASATDTLHRGIRGGRLALAVICDFLEENWPSMDLVAQMLLDRLRHDYSGLIDAVRLCPPMVRHSRILPLPANHWAALNADRLVNRFWNYPRWLRKRRSEFDLFHLVDHSYAQLVHELPAGRTIVTCHDLESFRPIFRPLKGVTSFAHRVMAQRILSGFRQAAHVTCDSHAIMQELLAHGLIAPERTTVVPNGFHPSCSPEPDAKADAEVDRLLGPVQGPEFLNVGATVPRKGIELLLQVFAEVRRRIPGARLIRAGGAFTTAQSGSIRRLRIGSSICVLPFLDRWVLAAAYRRASVVLQMSSYEGFGLPLVEAMACGTPVVASDIPVFREVGGSAVAYCPLNDPSLWSKTVVSLIEQIRDNPAALSSLRTAALSRAAAFTWDAYAARMFALYERVLNS